MRVNIRLINTSGQKHDSTYIGCKSSQFVVKRPNQLYEVINVIAMFLLSGVLFVAAWF